MTDDDTPDDEPDESQGDTYLAVEKTDDDTMLVVAFVDGIQVFYAEPAARNAAAVVDAAWRTYLLRAWPTLTAATET